MRRGFVKLRAVLLLLKVMQMGGKGCLCTCAPIILLHDVIEGVLARFFVHGQEAS